MRPLAEMNMPYVGLSTEYSSVRPGERAVANETEMKGRIVAANMVRLLSERTDFDLMRCWLRLNS